MERLSEVGAVESCKGGVRHGRKTSKALCALAQRGAVDTIKGSLLCALQNISFMLPVYMLYCLCVGYARRRAHGLAHPFYAAGTVICAAVILVCTYLQYNSTFLATYIETGVRRIESLAESCAGYRFRFSERRILQTSPRLS